MIEKKIRMALFLELLPQFLDEELAELLGEYKSIFKENRLMIGMGIQTINQEALGVIRRKISLRYFEKAFQLLQQNEIIIKTDIILGLPRETKESYYKTMEYICEKMRFGTNYLSLALLRILPGSDLEAIAQEEGIIIDNRDSAHFVYETPSLPREDMIRCLKMNVVAFRLLSSIDIENKMIMRNHYFKVKDSLGISNVEMLLYFVDRFEKILQETDNDYVRPDFPNAEKQFCNLSNDDIPDQIIFEEFHRLEDSGILRKRAN